MSSTLPCSNERCVRDIIDEALLVDNGAFCEIVSLGVFPVFHSAEIWPAEVGLEGAMPADPMVLIDDDDNSATFELL